MCLNLAISLQDMHSMGVLHNIGPDNIWIDFSMHTVMVYYTVHGKATFQRGRMFAFLCLILDWNPYLHQWTYPRKEVSTSETSETQR